jgi:gluconolactonase
MRVVTEDLIYPEGPIWMADGSVIVVDIADEALKRVQPNGSVETIAAVPGGPNGAAMGPNNSVYICNNGGMEWIDVQSGRLRPGLQSQSYKGGSIDVVDLATGDVRRLYDRCCDHLLRGPNDLVFDAHDGFYFTDMGKRRQRDMDLGSVYWARNDGTEICEIITGMISPNGIALSPDGRTLYVAETYTGRIWKWHVEGPGRLGKAAWPAPSGGSLYASPGGRIRFDGLAVSESGAVYAAALDSCAILEFRAPGGAYTLHTLPDLLVTNLCFGGTDMRTCFATLSHDPRLVSFDVHERGLALQHAS